MDRGRLVSSRYHVASKFCHSCCGARQAASYLGAIFSTAFPELIKGWILLC
jgi:hypothetical protein